MKKSKHRKSKVDEKDGRKEKQKDMKSMDNDEVQRSRGTTTGDKKQASENKKPEGGDERRGKGEQGGRSKEAGGENENEFKSHGRKKKERDVKARVTNEKRNSVSSQTEGDKRRESIRNDVPAAAVPGDSKKDSITQASSADSQHTKRRQSTASNSSSGSSGSSGSSRSASSFRRKPTRSVDVEEVNVASEVPSNVAGEGGENRTTKVVEKSNKTPASEGTSKSNHFFCFVVLFHIKLFYILHSNKY